MPISLRPVLSKVYNYTQTWIMKIHTAAQAHKFFLPSSTDRYHHSSHASAHERKTISSVICFCLQVRPYGQWKGWSHGHLCLLENAQPSSQTPWAGRIVKNGGWANAWCLRIISLESLAIALNQQITLKSFPRRLKVGALQAAISLSLTQAAGMWVSETGHLCDISTLPPDMSHAFIHKINNYVLFLHS